MKKRNNGFSFEDFDIEEGDDVIEVSNDETGTEIEITETPEETDISVNDEVDISVDNETPEGGVDDVEQAEMETSEEVEEPTDQDVVGTTTEESFYKQIAKQIGLPGKENIDNITQDMVSDSATNIVSSDIVDSSEVPVNEVPITDEEADSDADMKDAMSSEENVKGKKKLTKGEQAILFVGKQIGKGSLITEAAIEENTVEEKEPMESEANEEEPALVVKEEEEASEDDAGMEEGDTATDGGEEVSDTTVSIDIVQDGKVINLSADDGEVTKIETKEA